MVLIQKSAHSLNWLCENRSSSSASSTLTFNNSPIQQVTVLLHHQLSPYGSKLTSRASLQYKTVTRMLDDHLTTTNDKRKLLAPSSLEGNYVKCIFLHAEASTINLNGFDGISKNDTAFGGKWVKYRFLFQFPFEQICFDTVLITVQSHSSNQQSWGFFLPVYY